MKHIERLRIFNRLKLVERISSVGDRRESSAEHTWSCLILADYYLTKLNLDIDRQKVYELLMYHDVVEIIAGDTALEPGSDRTDKMQKEQDAADQLKQDLPEPLGEKFHKLFMEFEDLETQEARFAKAIDALDVIIQEMDHKEDWKGWSKDFVYEKKHHLFDSFPQMQEDFLQLLDYLEQEGYFSQA